MRTGRRSSKAAWTRASLLGSAHPRRYLELAAIVGGVVKRQIGSAAYVGRRRYLSLTLKDAEVQLVKGADGARPCSWSMLDAGAQATVVSSTRSDEGQGRQ
jgi:hypothetical protein